jgi:4-amino-4-deoxy-L-arabinose transferase-like glycosyltransferase
MKKLKKIIIKRSFWFELLTINLIIVSALLLRSYEVDTRPGYEWDEPVYTYIESHFSDNGYPTMLVEGGGGQEPYLYHPPFDFALRSYIFKITGYEGLTSARLISVIASGLALVIIYYFLKEVTSKQVSLISTLLISTDGWLIYTNRLNLIENIMIPIGVAAIAVYYYALNHKNKVWFALSGMLFAFTAIYKHTGIYFLGIPLLYMFLTKKYSRNHLVLYICAGAAVITYILAMYARWGNLYIDQTIVQVKRAVGIYNSRGLNYSISDALTALVRTYWLYISTIITLVMGTLLVIKNTINFFRTKKRPERPLLLSWSLASLIFFGAISLKNPQYLIMVLIPLYIYLTVKIVPYFLKKKYHKLQYLVLIFILVINAFTFYMRFVHHKDNALLATYNYVNNAVPDDAVVLTEESIGVGIRQKYFKLDLHNTAEEINKIKPNYVIIYLSTTQKPPKSMALDKLIQDSKLIDENIGFKEKVFVYKTNLL